MTDEDDWDFAGDDDAKVTNRAAVSRMPPAAIGVVDIIEIVRQAALDLSSRPYPFDDESPGG